MSYLDVNPMITALDESPEEFEFVSGWLHHVRSGHKFRFTPDEPVQLSADCNCALLEVRPDQQRKLAACFQEWETRFWRPLAINREFASHFSRRPLFERLLIKLTGRLHRWLLQRRPQHVFGGPKRLPTQAQYDRGAA